MQTLSSTIVITTDDDGHQELQVVVVGALVSVRYSAPGGVRGRGAHHENEGSVEREPGRGTFVSAIVRDLIDAVGKHRGPAIRLDGQWKIRETNVLAVRHLDTGEIIGRWLPLWRADGSPSTQLRAVLGRDNNNRSV